MQIELSVADGSMKQVAFPLLIILSLVHAEWPVHQTEPLTRVLADFEADQLVIEQGQKVRFLDKSEGNPIHWSWKFERGLPAQANHADPEIYYAKAGHYDVTITVSDGKTYDTKVIEDYVKVRGLLHHFRFDGLVRDEVNLNLPLGNWGKWTLCRDREGATNRALFLDSESQVLIKDHKGIKTNELTLSFWLRTMEKADHNTVLIEKYSGREKDAGFRILMKDGHLSFEGRDGSGMLRSTGAALNPIDDNEWHHITAVMTSDSHWQLWVDGILEADQYNSYTIPEQLNEADLSIGFSQWFEYDHFEGAIDELKIFNKALNMQAIVDLASQ